MVERDRLTGKSWVDSTSRLLIFISPVANRQSFSRRQQEARQRVRRTRNSGLREIEQNRVVAVYANTKTDLPGIRSDGEVFATLGAHVGRNAGLPQLDLAVVIDEAEGGVGGGNRDGVGARLQVSDGVAAERQRFTDKLSVAAEGQQWVTAGNEARAVAAPGDLAQISWTAKRNRSVAAS